MKITGTEPVANYSITSLGVQRSDQAASQSYINPSPNPNPSGSSSFSTSLNVGDTAGITFTYWALSSFGDSSYDAATTVRVDTAAPTTAANVSGLAGANGWRRGAVTLSLAAEDATSGVATIYLNGSAYAGPVTYSADGQYSFTYYSTDVADNTETLRTGLVKLDSTPPQNPAPTSANETHGVSNDDWQNSVSQPAFTWGAGNDPSTSSGQSGSGVAGYNVYFGPDSNGASAVAFVTSPAYALPAAVAGGTYYLRVQTVDQAGNTADWVTLFVFRYDHTAPGNPSGASETHGVENANWQGSVNDLAFIWEAGSDSLSGLAGYAVYFGRDTNGTSNTLVTTPAYDPGPVSSGAYYLRVQTRDNAGNAAPWVTLFTFQYDSAPPANPTTATESHGVNESTWQNAVADPSFTWAGSDAESGIEDYAVYFGTDPQGTSNTQVTSLPYTPPVLTQSGQYYLRVRARDAVGNLAAAPSNTGDGWQTLFSFFYDNTPPANPMRVNLNAGCVALDKEWQNTCNDPAFSWTGMAASRDDAGIAGHHIYFGADPAGVSTQFITADTFDPPAVSSGVSYFRLQTKDQAGNLADWQTLFTFQFDNDLPTLTNLTPAELTRSPLARITPRSSLPTRPGTRRSSRARSRLIRTPRRPLPIHRTMPRSIKLKRGSSRTSKNKPASSSRSKSGGKPSRNSRWTVGN